jgi:hypothetical protein
VNTSVESVWAVTRNSRRQGGILSLQGAAVLF